ncbi:hypothetical protein ATN84_07310 [Paramesorhizobium deserti]|uniref:Uncharacterized protein n=1 Tax=Paramesorhizobium deserti TaxID=1494590 RepID=A0A135HVL3_9HYPH|nr:hypothetical protein [Paramesorhizobium deserti]KXF77214.1 hypothetical protein ATN84_07310 [Paramesorhizobium deserti]
MHVDEAGYIAAIRFAQHGAARAFWYCKNRDGSYVRRRLALTPAAQAAHKVFNTAFWLESLSVADPAHGSGALSLVYVMLALTGLFPRVGRGLAPLSDAPGGDPYEAHIANIRNDPRLLAGVIDILPQLMLQPSGSEILPSSTRPACSCSAITPNRLRIRKAGCG